jgi:hypothetical protein
MYQHLQIPVFGAWLGDNKNIPCFLCFFFFPKGAAFWGQILLTPGFFEEDQSVGCVSERKWAIFSNPLGF